jgi:hypothetical protein
VIYYEAFIGANEPNDQILTRVKAPTDDLIWSDHQENHDSYTILSTILLCPKFFNVNFLKKKIEHCKTFFDKICYNLFPNPFFVVECQEEEPLSSLILNFLLKTFTFIDGQSGNFGTH